METEEKSILERLGWNNYFEEQFIKRENINLEAGRVVWENRGFYKVESFYGNSMAKLRGKAINEGVHPVTGDWVLFSKEEGTEFLIIEKILERKSKISRKTAGEQSKEQILASNVDIVFIVTALNEDFNLRRIERYLSVVWESGAKPVIVLTKKDLAEDFETKLAQVEIVAFNTPIVAVSSITNENVDIIREMVQYGETAVLIGSSGAGKSTLINSVIGENILKTGNIREDDGMGRHTTTSREMIFLKNGGIFIDSPGLREIQLWAHNGVSAVFEDIESYILNCKFKNCTHTTEPGCAVRTAIENGELSEKRYESYCKLKKEERYIAGKSDEKIRQEEKKKWKDIGKLQKMFKDRGKK